MRNEYEVLPPNADIQGLMDWAQNVTRNRIFDLEDYDNQVASNPVIYSPPSSSSDLIGTEKEGDIAADSGFFYIVIDNAGDLEWRRAALSSF